MPNDICENSQLRKGIAYCMIQKVDSPRVRQFRQKCAQIPMREVFTISFFKNSARPDSQLPFEHGRKNQGKCTPRFICSVIVDVFRQSAKHFFPGTGTSEYHMVMSR